LPLSAGTGNRAERDAAASVEPSLVFTSSSKDNIPAELGNSRTALATEIEETAPYAKHIAVLNYYQPIPSPLDFKQASIFPGGGQVDPVCWGLSHNLKDAYNDAVIIQAALTMPSQVRSATPLALASRTCS
jgi:hypothetical protein